MTWNNLSHFSDSLYFHFKNLKSLTWNVLWWCVKCSWNRCHSVVFYQFCVILPLTCLSSDCKHNSQFLEFVTDDLILPWLNMCNMNKLLFLSAPIFSSKTEDVRNIIWNITPLACIWYYCLCLFSFKWTTMMATKQMYYHPPILL